jgi:hypothetical protein
MSEYDPAELTSDSVSTRVDESAGNAVTLVVKTLSTDVDTNAFAVEIPTTTCLQHRVVAVALFLITSWSEVVAP